MNAPGPGLRASIVIATYNRGERIRRLLDDLEAQSVPASAFEVIVVDDGSKPPARTFLEGLAPVFPFRFLEQANAGAAAARHRGALEARGDVLVVTDDDMVLPPDFMERHLSFHSPGTRRVVLGQIRWPEAVERMPIFERWHAGALKKKQGAPALRPHGDALCTGNVSMRRADYLDVGGFDLTMSRGEDMDLGLRLELAGVEVVPGNEAYVVHDSDHTDFAIWRNRCVQYGRYGLRMARKYPSFPYASPWRPFFANAPVKRPILAFSATFPAAARFLADAVESMALAADSLGLERLALAGVSLLWDVEYFRGLRLEAGSLRETTRSCLDFLELAAQPGQSWPGVGSGTITAGRLASRITGRAWGSSTDRTPDQ
jgi:glycosyltransferase involved in cell wall biosynthesis